MNKKLVSLMIWVVVLISMLVQATVSAEISVGVKEGDWIEYNIVFFGGTPPSSYPKRYKIEVLSVQGTTVTSDLTTEWSNRTQETYTFTVDFETGQLGDVFMIPANLNYGDVFYHVDAGFIMITGVEERTYAETRRTILYANVSDNEFYWDRATGVLVEWLIISEYWEAVMNVEIINTNMWQMEFLPSTDPTIFYVLIIITVAAVLIVVAAAFLMEREPKKTKPKITKKKTRKKTR